MAGLRAIACDQRLRMLARASSSGVTEESARLVQLVRDFQEYFTEFTADPSHKQSEGAYRFDAAPLDAKAALTFLSLLPLPTLYYGKDDETVVRRPGRMSVESLEPRLPLLKVIAFIDGSPLVCPQVLRPGVMYSLRFRVRGSFWPVAAERLFLEFISTCPAASYVISPFEITRPNSDGDVEGEAEGNIMFHAAQSLGAMNLGFTVRCRFAPQSAANADPVVVGHHRLQFRVGDLNRLAIASGYRRMDARVLELLQGLQNSTPAVVSELPQMLPVLEALASFLGIYSQRGVFKGSTQVSESEFQEHVVNFMRIRLGEEVQEHGNQAGGITDVRYQGVIVELKVERETGDRARICKKYTAQPTQYQGSEGRQVSVLLVLDLTEKDLPPGDTRNDILLTDVPTHGGRDHEKPHPSRAFVFVLNGNIRSPSSYS